MGREYWDKNLWNMFLKILDKNSSVINMVVRRITGMYISEQILQSQWGDISDKFKA